MGLLGKIFGPKSKYDKSLPYTSEARIRTFEDGSEHKTYLSDTICGLVEHLERNGIAPAEALVVGDSRNDVAGARAAGCPVFCVPYGYSEGEDVRELGADAIVGTLEEAARRLREI